MLSLLQRRGLPIGNLQAQLRNIPAQVCTTGIAKNNDQRIYPMLQKLLIAFCTVFLLSACGSSSNDAPAPQEPPPVDDNNDDDDDSNGDDEDANGDDEDANGDDDDAGGDDEDANGDDDSVLTFDMGDTRWTNDGSEATLEYHEDNDVLVMTPDFTMVDCPQDWDADALCTYIANHTVDGPLDLRGTHFVFELEISQSILDNGGEPGGIVLQAYGQERSGDYGGYWGCEVNNQDIEDTSVTYACTMPEDNDALNFAEGGDTGQVGLQVLRGDNDNDDGGVNNDIEGTITMKSFRIYLDGPPPSDDDDDDANGDDDDANGDDEANGGDDSAENEYSVQVASDWQNDGSPASFSYDDGVVITPDWDEADQQTAFAILDEAVDMTDATVTYVIYVPESYIDDGGMVIQPFSQQNDGDYAAISDGSISGGWNPASGLEAGENTIVHGPFSEPPENIQRVGVWLNKQDMADDVTGDIIIRSVTITFPE